MNARKFAEVGLALLGAYAVVRAVEVLPSHLIGIPLMWGDLGSAKGALSAMIMLIPFACLAALAWLLVKYRKALAGRLAPCEDAERPLKEAATSSEEKAYRIASVFAGFIALAWALPKAGPALVNFFFLSREVGLENVPDHVKEGLVRGRWSLVASFVIQIGLAVFLLLDAPRIGRWLASRARKPDLPPPEPAS